MMLARSLFRSTVQLTKFNPIRPLYLGAPLTRYRFTSSSDPTQAALLEEVEGKVYQVLKSAAKCNQAKLNRSATFEELGFDSLDSVELVVAME
jgi:NADH dehydrogenase (ubiquinone) 1 alpha/beta subcomplex 1, acyl-carrier protein